MTDKTNYRGWTVLFIFNQVITILMLLGVILCIVGGISVADYVPYNSGGDVVNELLSLGKILMIGLIAIVSGFISVTESIVVIILSIAAIVNVKKYKKAGKFNYFIVSIINGGISALVLIAALIFVVVLLA